MPFTRRYHASRTIDGGSTFYLYTYWEWSGQGGVPVEYWSISTPMGPNACKEPLCRLKNRDITGQRVTSLIL